MCGSAGGRDVFGLEETEGRSSAGVLGFIDHGDRGHDQLDRGVESGGDRGLTDLPDVGCLDLWETDCSIL